MFPFRKSKPARGGWYVHLTVDGITFLRFVRTKDEADALWREFYKSFAAEAKQTEVAA
jgi:hypothetical protein